MRLVSVFRLTTNNQTKNECFPKFIRTGNASPSMKRPIVSSQWRLFNKLFFLNKWSTFRIPKMFNLFFAGLELSLFQLLTLPISENIYRGRACFSRQNELKYLSLVASYGKNIRLKCEL